MASAAVITGATGLLGSWVLSHWDVPGVTPVPVSGSDVDLLARGAATDLLARTQPAYVVHLAWCASGRPDYRGSSDNDRWVEASLELVAAARAMGSAVWLTGTVVDETREALDAYSRAKARLKTTLASDIGSGAVGWLRPFYVFDEKWRRPGVVDHAVAARDRGEPVQLQTPAQAHDFVHASDVGSAIVTAVGHGLTGEVPIGSGALHTVADVVTALGGEWSAATEVPREQAHLEHVADTHRLTALGWGPTRTEEFFAHD
ncbi:MAG: NAD(P)-dependent oxidoreductase [Nocardioides sp.]